jgi:hypothetical protein
MALFTVGQVLTSADLNALTSNLAVLNYNPAGNTNYGPLSSSVLVQLDATNLSVTFLAPASGNVLWHWECAAAMAAGVNLSFQAYNVTTSALVGRAQIVTENANTIRIGVTDTITGLTPGTSYTFTPAYVVGGSTASLYGGGSQGGYLQTIQQF